MLTAGDRVLAMANLAELVENRQGTSRKFPTKSERSSLSQITVPSCDRDAYPRAVSAINERTLRKIAKQALSHPFPVFWEKLLFLFPRRKS